MDLDNLINMQLIDTQNILGEINALPDQLREAWDLGQTLPMPDMKGIDRICVFGMGTAGTGAELLAAYATPDIKLPVMVHRDYELPGYAAGKNTLFIAVSHSGDTEETLFAFEEAQKRGCQMIALCSGGKLAEKATESGSLIWRFSHRGPARSAIGYHFGMLLAAFCRLGLLPNQDELIAASIAAMKAQQETLLASVPAFNNPAKRYAGQLVGRWVTIFGAGLFAIVARRWKNQVNEMAKAPANAEQLPEADHNTLAGIFNPADDLLMPHTMTLFISAPSDMPKNRVRTTVTRQSFMLEALNTDMYFAQGDNRLAQLWSAVHFGDYLAYYLAIAYGTDPTPTDTIANIKSMIGGR